MTIVRWACAMLLALMPALVGAAPKVTATGSNGSVVSLQGIGFGAIGQDVTPIDPLHPLPAADASNTAFIGASTLTVGVAAVAGRSVLLNCSGAGNVSLTFADASVLIVPALAGLSILPFAVTAVNSSGTTATCSYANLK